MARSRKASKKEKREFMDAADQFGHTELVEFYEYVFRVLREGYDPKQSVFQWQRLDERNMEIRMNGEGSEQLTTMPTKLFTILAAEFFMRGRQAALQQIRHGIVDGPEKEYEDIQAALDLFLREIKEVVPNKYDENLFEEVEALLLEAKQTLSNRAACEIIFRRNELDLAGAKYEGFERSFYNFRKKRRVEHSGGK